jgi:predicted extracellular nuclease
LRDPEVTLERYEGMRVALELDGVVSGPTTRYISRFPAGDPEIALVPPDSLLAGRRVFAGEVPVGRGMVYLSGGLGRDLPEVRVGDRLTASTLSGILAYQFGRYVLLIDQDPSSIAVQRAPEPPLDQLSIGPDEFGVCSFNLENLYDAADDADGDIGDWSPADRSEYATRVEKRAQAIAEDLAGCAVVALQEVEGKDEVWSRLAAAAGDYRYDYYESADARDITVGILYDPTRVTVNHSEASQACSETDFGVDYTFARGPRAQANPCAAGYPVFDRPPYIADLTVRSVSGEDVLELRVIVNHLKSRRGDETENRPQRLAQAQHVARLLEGPRRIALGDFNDTPDSATMQQFSAFADLYDTHALRADAYTYIYNGLAETPDYAIATLDLLRYIKTAGPVHINADYPDLRVPDRTSRRSSDHDPLFVRFIFQPETIVLGWRRFYEGRWRQNQSLRLK